MLRAGITLGLILTNFAVAQDANPTSHLRWRGIGPGNMSGRISAIDALDSDWRVVVIGSASGGVFLSRNAGTTFEPIFDRYGSGSIGAVAICQSDPSQIWVGTGEANNRNSVGWGDGIYKSADGGKSFRNVGLRDTRQIADIAIHPRDPNIVFVAAIGALWGDSGSRGLYLTKDGGESWEELRGGLPDGPVVGCTEVVIHPNDPTIVLCGMYERRRSPWWMQSGGSAGGIFKSTDGGRSWRKLTDGLPVGDTGMIDLDYCRSDPNIVVAAVEASDRLDDTLAIPGPGIYRSDDGGESWRYLLRTTVRPFYHGQVAIDPNDPTRIYSVGREFKVSKDGGATWVSRWWGGGGDDHDLWISPQDGRIRYMATDQGAHFTIDDGESVVAFENLAVGQYYAIGVDHAEPYRILGGLQDNGLWLTPSNSRDPRGILNSHSSWVGEGDGFHAQIDPIDNRTAYIVNHVGFAARVDLVTREHRFITPNPDSLVNFDEWFDPNFAETPIVYTIDPGEHWFFGYRPDRKPLPPQFRANWSAPLVLSPHDPHTIYFAHNHLFESRDRGESWRILGPDLTTNDPNKRNPSKSGGLTREVTGGENHCTIVTIGPSPLSPAILWCGTDDGLIQCSRDGGRSWQECSKSLSSIPNAPKPGAWISRVTPSHRAIGRCYVTIDDHRRDDDRPYVFVTEDFGSTWSDITGNLPASGSAYVVREHPTNADLLFVGTEFGAFASIDRGTIWYPIGQGLPTVAVHDLVFHPRDHDLIAGTHGRALWIADDLSALGQLTPELRARDLALLTPRRATKWHVIDHGRRQPSFLQRGRNPESAAYLHVWSKLPQAGRAKLSVESMDGTLRWQDEFELNSGMQRVAFPLRFRVASRDREQARGSLAIALAEHEPRSLRGGVPAPAGTYRVILQVGDRREVGSLEIRDDPLR
jgi:photosystem II stability/assembly factor-like uncharacterized protein